LPEAVRCTKAGTLVQGQGECFVFESNIIQLIMQSKNFSFPELNISKIYIIK